MLIALFAIGTTIWNVVVAAYRWGPSFSLLGMSATLMCIPCVLFFNSRKIAEYDDEYVGVWFFLAILALVVGAYWLTYHMDPNAFSYILVPFGQLLIAIPMRIALARRRRGSVR